MNQSAAVLRLRWEAAKHLFMRMLAAYEQGEISADELAAFEVAEDAAYTAYMAV